MNDFFKLVRAPARSGKKWSVRVPTPNGNGRTISFGDAAMQDYTMHKDKDRRERYRRRHMWDRIDDPYKAGFWSWYVLWGESSSLRVAFADAVRRAKRILFQ